MPRHIRRASVIALALALATAVAAACASGSARKPAPTPTLTLTSRNPVTVAGRHFAPRVKVRVVVNAGATRSQNAVPNSHGAFTATFAAVIDRCTNWSVRATQPGRAPVLIRGAKPGCPPA